MAAMIGSASQSAPPDEDLQNLYDQVIAGFVEEQTSSVFPTPPTSARREVHSLGPPQYSTAPSGSPRASYTPSSFTQPRAERSDSVTSRRTSRRLPQVPGRQSPAIPSAMASMPEPQPYLVQSRYSLSGRRLPNPPRDPTFAPNGRQYASYIDHVDINRNSSTTSTSSTGTGTSFGRAPSTAATTVERGNSYGFSKHAPASSQTTFGFPSPQIQTYDGYFSGTEEEDFTPIDPSLLSNIAIKLRDRIPRSTHVKASIPYPRAFSGEDIVSTIQSLIQPYILAHHSSELHDRRAALQVAHSLQQQLFFYEVEWSEQLVADRSGDVYLFLDENEVTPDGQSGTTGLPTSVITYLSKCYSPSCAEGASCYAFSCPRRISMTIASTPVHEPIAPEQPTVEWHDDVLPEVLASLPEAEVRRQTIIRKVADKEQQYIHDLDLIESIFLNPLRNTTPPPIPHSRLGPFIRDVFNEILALRAHNQKLIDAISTRQREGGEVISKVGDVFLSAVRDFESVYPAYIARIPMNEKLIKDEMEINAEFRRFIEECVRKPENTHKLDLKHFLSRPSEHFKSYAVLFEAIQKETAEGDPDIEVLAEAVAILNKLEGVSQLWAFQTAMGKGPTGKFDWFDLVPEDVRAGIPKKAAKRQAVIFELIKGEMAYVKDLENIEYMYVKPLQESNPPIIPHARLNSFIHDVYHNYGELYAHHRRLVDKLHVIQKKEHPLIYSITAPLLTAVTEFRTAYLEYIANYPIAAYRIVDEMETNPAFKTFVDDCIRHPESHRLDMKSFVNRPIPRLLRYDLLLKEILKECPEGHSDIQDVPKVLDMVKALGLESEPGVVTAKEKVEIWKYNSGLMFKPGEYMDLDLLHASRSLVHTGKLLRQPDTGFEWGGWTDMVVILFDNYLVMAKAKETEGATKYQVYRRPIPLELLTLGSFTDPATQRGSALLNFRGGKDATPASEFAPPGPGSPGSAHDSRVVYPCTIIYSGRQGGPYTLYAETPQARTEWKAKLEEAIRMRKIMAEKNKVFEVATLSVDTFPSPPLVPTPGVPQDSSFTGKVTCSVPFTTSDGRRLVAVGCVEGVWIGYRYDPKSLVRVLHLKTVTQCAILERYGVFLVLADKSLWAYHIESLVPSAHGSGGAPAPQKMSGNKDVHFFSVGNFRGRTLVISMKKKGLDSVFSAVEPVMDKINERTKAPTGIGSRFGLRSHRSDWFRPYRDFFLPSESYDVLFLKTNVVILCNKGYEIMDLDDFKSITIPEKADPRIAAMIKRCESCKPLGMFRSVKDEFLLCYDEFGLYVDKHGDQSRRIGTIEWEGTAEKVAWHPPYVVLFDQRFIEVRHVVTGRLVQLIHGSDARCLWDGRSAISGADGMMPTAESGWDDGFSLEPRIHGAVSVQSPRNPRGLPTQQLFELVPTKGR